MPIDASRDPYDDASLDPRSSAKASAFDRDADDKLGGADDGRDDVSKDDTSSDEADPLTKGGTTGGRLGAGTESKELGDDSPETTASGAKLDHSQVDDDLDDIEQAGNGAGGASFDPSGVQKESSLVDHDTDDDLADDFDLDDVGSGAGVKGSILLDTEVGDDLDGLDDIDALNGLDDGPELKDFGPDDDPDDGDPVSGKGGLFDGLGDDDDGVKDFDLDDGPDDGDDGLFDLF